MLPVVVLVWALMVERLSPGLSAFWGAVFMIFILITQRPLFAFFRKRGDDIVAAVRTAIGGFGGSLKDVPLADLAHMGEPVTLDATPDAVARAPEGQRGRSVGRGAQRMRRVPCDSRVLDFIAHHILNTLITTDRIVC